MGVVGGHLPQCRGLEAVHDQLALHVLLLQVLGRLSFLLKLLRGLHKVSGVNGFSRRKPAERLIQVQVLLGNVRTECLSGSRDELHQLVAVVAAADGFQAGNRLGIDQCLTALAFGEGGQLALTAKDVHQPAHQRQL